MVARKTFADKEALATALADAVAGHLSAGISTRGRASLAVSGGSTPKNFFIHLSAHTDVEWSKVTITLVDERWVDESSERSNALLVKQHLMQGPAANATFVPLYSGGEEPDDGQIAKTNALQAEVPHPFDAVILGMGGDGHTASFFPGGDTLEQALNDPGPALAINAPGAGEARVTLTLPYLLSTAGLHLHIEGAEKAEVERKALEAGPIADMPIRAVLRQTQTPLTVFWCA